MKNTKFKPKRTLITLAALLLVIVLIISLSVPVLAANDIRYRMVLRYYDPIQITYNIKYPADGDNYEGAQDVPIGGVGVAGDGNYGISSFLSTQVYCADPFTPFHGRVGQGI
ncbi:MAG: hypothetical protein FWE66_03680, partial [Oscillospiraceae bacterium]|nr:hypothetical protein [Oscillospiraceae bacterium]